MRTFERISDEHLLIEAIRRLRVRNALGGGRTAPEGTRFDSILNFFQPLKGLDLVVLQNLLSSGEIIADPVEFIWPTNFSG